jgi:hypothetical protein
VLNAKGKALQVMAFCQRQIPVKVAFDLVAAKRDFECLESGGFHANALSRCAANRTAASVASIFRGPDPIKSPQKRVTHWSFGFPVHSSAAR